MNHAITRRFLNRAARLSPALAVYCLRLDAKIAALNINYLLGRSPRQQELRRELAAGVWVLRRLVTEHEMMDFSAVGIARQGGWR